MHFPVTKLHTIVSANGAGDSFLGGFITGLVYFTDKDEIAQISKAVNVGIKCSAKTIMNTENVSPEINPDLLDYSK